MPAIRTNRIGLGYFLSSKTSRTTRRPGRDRFVRRSPLGPPEEGDRRSRVSLSLRRKKPQRLRRPPHPHEEDLPLPRQPKAVATDPQVEQAFANSTGFNGAIVVRPADRGQRVPDFDPPLGTGAYTLLKFLPLYHDRAAPSPMGPVAREHPYPANPLRGHQSRRSNGPALLPPATTTADHTGPGSSNTTGRSSSTPRERREPRYPEIVGQKDEPSSPRDLALLPPAQEPRRGGLQLRMGLSHELRSASMAWVFSTLPGLRPEGPGEARAIRPGRIDPKRLAIPPPRFHSFTISYPGPGSH